MYTQQHHSYVLIMDPSGSEEQQQTLATYRMSETIFHQALLSVLLLSVELRLVSGWTNPQSALL